MKCALCPNEANRKNTHYLTDAIIRTCLNQGGSSIRGKGLYFELSDSSMEFNFQQGTSIGKVEEYLGRPATEEEILNAKQIPYSVDYIFCGECESKFGVIETEFANKILPKFRQANLTTLQEISTSEIRVVRLFFYLQILRTHICQDIKLSAECADFLCQTILNHKNFDDIHINKYPIAVTYLETLGDFTTNMVLLTRWNTFPKLIFMCDFVIQFYESKEKVDFFDFYGLNSKNDFANFINLEESEFKIKIIHDEDRKKLLSEITMSKKISPMFEKIKNNFIEIWHIISFFQNIIKYCCA